MWSTYNTGNPSADFGGQPTLYVCYEAGQIRTVNGGVEESASDFVPVSVVAGAADLMYRTGEARLAKRGAAELARHDARMR